MTDFSPSVPARYKSQSQRGRHAAGYDAPPPPTGFFSDSEADLAPKRAATIARSRSRYRRPAPPPVDLNQPMPNSNFATPHRSPTNTAFNKYEAPFVLPTTLKAPNNDDYRSPPKSANSSGHSDNGQFSKQDLDTALQKLLPKEVQVERVSRKSSMMMISNCKY